MVAAHCNPNKGNMKMGKATKVKTIASTPLNATFEADKATIYQAFTSLVDFDWKLIGLILTKYQGDKPLFEQIRMVCREHSIARVFKKADIIKSETAIAELARLDGNKPEHKDALAKMTEADKAARKGAANDWFGFTARIGYKTPETRGGANNKAGSNGKPKPTTPAPHHDIAPKVPTTVESFVAADMVNLETLKEAYASVKSMLIKVQNRNSKLYVGDEGGKLLALHKNIIELLNFIK